MKYMIQMTGCCEGGALEPQESPGVKLKILLVGGDERDKAWTYVYADNLLKAGLSAIYLNNFESASYLLSLDKIDAIIVNPVVHLENSSLICDEGILFVKRTKKAYPHIPIFSLSAIPPSCIRKEFYEEGIEIEAFFLMSSNDEELLPFLVKKFELNTDILKKYQLEMYPTKKAKVFISYSRADAAKALTIYELLEQKHYTPWIDQINILPGQDWEIEISKAIKSSDFFVACLSNNSVTKTGYFQKELKRGMEILDLQPEGAIYLIPLRLDDCVVPVRFEHLHWCNLFETHGIAKLVEALNLGCKEKCII